MMLSQAWNHSKAATPFSRYNYVSRLSHNLPNDSNSPRQKLQMTLGVVTSLPIKQMPCQLLHLQLFNLVLLDVVVSLMLFNEHPFLHFEDITACLSCFGFGTYWFSWSLSVRWNAPMSFFIRNCFFFLFLFCRGISDMGPVVILLIWVFATIAAVNAYDEGWSDAHATFYGGGDASGTMGELKFFSI